MSKEVKKEMPIKSYLEIAKTPAQPQPQPKKQEPQAPKKQPKKSKNDDEPQAYVKHDPNYNWLQAWCDEDGPNDPDYLSYIRKLDMMDYRGY